MSKTTKTTHTIVIHVEGGLVQGIACTDPNVAVIVIDTDVEGSDRFEDCPTDIVGLGIHEGDDVVLERHTPISLWPSVADDLRAHTKRVIGG